MQKLRRKTSRQVLCAQVNEENQTLATRKSGAACLSLPTTGNFKSISETASWFFLQQFARQRYGQTQCFGPRSLRTVILLELTCPAEEGIEAAQIRKEARYAGLMEEITEQKWTPTLLTLEVGARGLVGSRTFRSFVTLGFSVQSANQLCKSLSDIVSRCSYAIYLAHSTAVWPHNSDLVECRSSLPTLDDETVPCVQKQTSQKLVPNIVTLKRNGIEKLYHFTDASNLPSIDKHGLMSASNLV